MLTLFLSPLVWEVALVQSAAIVAEVAKVGAHRWCDNSSILEDDVAPVKRIKALTHCKAENTLIVIPNNKLLAVISEQTPVQKLFGLPMTFCVRVQGRYHYDPRFELTLTLLMSEPLWQMLGRL